MSSTPPMRDWPAWPRQPINRDPFGSGVNRMEQLGQIMQRLGFAARDATGRMVGIRAAFETDPPDEDPQCAVHGISRCTICIPPGVPGRLTGPDAVAEHDDLAERYGGCGVPDCPVCSDRED